MATYGAFTSKLEAVNQMLSTIGQSRISTLATAGEANDAQKILEEIDKAVQTEGWHFNRFLNVELPLGTVSMNCTRSSTTAVATTDPHYLVDKEQVTIGGVDIAITLVSATAFTLATASPVSNTSFFFTQRIGVPSDALNLDTSTFLYSNIDPIVRGRFLFDRGSNSYEFTDKVKACVTYQVPFQQESDGEPSLPEYARRYITMKAARVFAQRHVGDPELVNMAGREEMEARMNLIQLESENSDSSIFDSALAYATVARAGASDVAPIGSLWRSY